MRMVEIDYEAQPPVDGYGPGGFRIAGTWHDGAVVLSPEGVAGIEGLDAAGLAPLLAGADALDLILFGMGGDIAPLPPDLRAAVETAGLGYETMSTASACRTYNVLLTEDRRVAVVLLPVHAVRAPD